MKKVLVEKMGVPDEKARSRIRHEQLAAECSIVRCTVKLGREACSLSCITLKLHFLFMF